MQQNGENSQPMVQTAREAERLLADRPAAETRSAILRAAALNAAERHEVCRSDPVRRAPRRRVSWSVLADLWTRLMESQLRMAGVAAAVAASLALTLIARVPRDTQTPSPTMVIPNDVATAPAATGATGANAARTRATIVASNAPAVAPRLGAFPSRQGRVVALESVHPQADVVPPSIAAPAPASTAVVETPSAVNSQTLASKATSSVAAKRADLAERDAPMGVDQSGQESAEHWIKRIAELRASGLDMEADKELAALIKVYPLFPIPDRAKRQSH